MPTVCLAQSTHSSGQSEVQTLLKLSPPDVADGDTSEWVAVRPRGAESWGMREKSVLGGVGKREQVPVMCLVVREGPPGRRDLSRERFEGGIGVSCVSERGLYRDTLEIHLMDTVWRSLRKPKPDPGCSHQ